MTTILDTTKGNLIKPIKGSIVNGFEAILVRPGIVEYSYEFGGEVKSNIHYLEVSANSVEKWKRTPVAFICRDYDPEAVKTVKFETCGVVIKPEMTIDGVKGIVIIDEPKVYEELLAAYKDKREIVVACTYYAPLEPMKYPKNAFKTIAADFYQLTIMIPGGAIKPDSPDFPFSYGNYSCNLTEERAL